MSTVLTSDPIVDEQTVMEMLALTGPKARMYINAVTALFKQYTGRSRLGRGAVVDMDKAPPPSVPVYWLRATPVESLGSIKLYRYGEEVRELGTADYTLSPQSGRVYLSTSIPGYPTPDLVIRSEYVGGWDTVPGDVAQTALEMVRLQHARLQGRVGVTSESREGHSASYDASAIPQSVRDVWRMHKVY